MEKSNLSNVDTIGTAYVCPQYGVVHISGASSWIFGRRGNPHSGFSAWHAWPCFMNSGLLYVGEKAPTALLVTNTMIIICEMQCDETYHWISDGR